MLSGFGQTPDHLLSFSSAEGEFAHDVQCFLVSVELLSLTGHQLNSSRPQEKEVGDKNSCKSFFTGGKRGNMAGYEKTDPIKTRPNPGREEQKASGKKRSRPVEDSKVKVLWNKNLLKFYL